LQLRLIAFEMLFLSLKGAGCSWNKLLQLLAILFRREQSVGKDS